MLFTEPAFVFLFLPVTLALYFAVPRRGRNLILTLASLFYYTWGESRFLPFMLGSIIANYYIALAIEKERGTPTARAWLVAGLCIDLGLLVVFKYSGFLVENLNQALALLTAGPVHVKHILLPLGISFFTFHKISYKVDVYRGTAQAKRNPVELTLYILLFPQLIAGPIVRYHEIAAQLSERSTRVGQFAYGLRRFLTGLGKKVLLANMVATSVDTIYALPANRLTPELAWLAAIRYSLQLYFDFSGYSDMAIGLAAMVGFTFPENFNHPYISRSITEFWRRWHMTLSRWFRDYLYIPLGGNRSHLYRNLVLVFFLCGLWHGASWTFVVWGLFHGAFLVLERTRFGTWQRSLAPAFQHFYALLVIVIGWVFFRSPTLEYALHFIRTMFSYAPGGLTPAVVGDQQGWLAMGIGLLACTPLATAVYRTLLRLWRFAPRTMRPLLSGALRASLAVYLGAIFLLSMAMVAGGSYDPFIYYRF